MKNDKLLTALTGCVQIQTIISRYIVVIFPLLAACKNGKHLFVRILVYNKYDDKTITVFFTAAITKISKSSLNMFQLY